MIESITERMEIIADMLGVELDEEFEVQDSLLSSYKITEQGMIDSEGSRGDPMMGALLTGRRTIIKRPKGPWEPIIGDDYWYVTPDGIVDIAASFIPDVSIADKLNSRIGNCFPDRETAEANIDIMLQKFNTPEIIPASWTPDNGERYWCTCGDGIADLMWAGDLEDYTLKAIGSLYRTEAEALADYPNLRKRLGMSELPDGKKEG